MPAAVRHHHVSVSSPVRIINTRASLQYAAFSISAVFMEMLLHLMSKEKVWVLYGKDSILKILLKLKSVIKTLYLSEIREKNLSTQDVKDMGFLTYALWHVKYWKMSFLTHCWGINDTFLSSINVLVLIFITEICSCVFKEFEIVQHRGRIR